MTQNNWSKWGEDLKKTVQDSIDSRDFSHLNESIGSIVDSAISNLNETLKNSQTKTYTRRASQWTQDAREQAGQTKSTYRTNPPRRNASDRYRNTKDTQFQAPKVYGGTGEIMALGIVFLVFGILGITGFSIGILSVLLVTFLGNPISYMGGITASAVQAALLAGSIFLTAKGKGFIGLVNRFRQYKAVISEKMYVSLEDLSKRTGRNLNFIQKDLKKMMRKRFFCQGHLDDKESCLMLSDESYQLYQQAQQQYLLREKEKQEKEAKNASLPENVRQVVEEGERFIQKIHASNDAIPGEEISRKIDHMENIVRKIFQRVRQKPALVGDLKKLMSYYLPTTIKLLDAYEELDAQPIQGPNITSSKKEIEDTMDTLNTAFEKILDDFYQDTAWDISSDISVLETMLAQEGLTKSDFDKV